MSEEQKGAKRRRTDEPAEEWRKYTPSNIDLTKCMARTWGDRGSGGQCSKCPVSGSRFCGLHQKKEGKKGWHGAVDGEIPADKLADFRAKGRPRDVDLAARGEVGESVSGGARSAGGDVSVRASAPPAAGADAVYAGGGSEVAVTSVDRAAGRAEVSRAGGPRIVTGFGSERVEDVASHEMQRESEAMARAARRRGEGSRGRMTGFDGEDLDRAAGGPWQAGRR